MAAQMVASLLGELVFLPAMLCLFSNRRKASPAPAQTIEAEEEGGEVRSLPLRPHFQLKPKSQTVRH
jgi:hypothetical protein